MTFPSIPRNQRLSAGRLRGMVALEILSVLADVPRATVAKLAEDIDRDEASVRVRLRDLLEYGLAQEAGRLPLPPGQKRGRGAMTYRIHTRLRT